MPLTNSDEHAYDRFITGKKQLYSDEKTEEDRRGHQKLI